MALRTSQCRKGSSGPRWTQKCPDFLDFSRRDRRAVQEDSHQTGACSAPRSAFLPEVGGEGSPHPPGEGPTTRHLPGRAQEDSWARAGKAWWPESHLPSCRAPGSSSTLQGAGSGCFLEEKHTYVSGPGRTAENGGHGSGFRRRFSQPGPRSVCALHWPTSLSEWQVP